MGHGEALGTLSGGDIAVIILVILLLAIIGLVVNLIKAKKLPFGISLKIFETRKEINRETVPSTTDNQLQTINQIEQSKESEQPEPEPEYVIGKGGYKCLVLRNEILEPSTINKPLGNIFIAAASMPIMGSVYLIQEYDGEITAYDPRVDEFKQEESPQMAYFATSWDIVDDIFNYVIPWWKSSPLWVTIGIGVLLLITLMIYFG